MTCVTPLPSAMILCVHIQTSYSTSCSYPYTFDDVYDPMSTTMTTHIDCTSSRLLLTGVSWMFHSTQITQLRSHPYLHLVSLDSLSRCPLDPSLPFERYHFDSPPRRISTFHQSPHPRPLSSTCAWAVREAVCQNRSIHRKSGTACWFFSVWLRENLG